MIKLRTPVRVSKNVSGGVGVADSSNRILCVIPHAPDAVLVAEGIVKAINRPRWWHRFRVNKPYTRVDWEWDRPWWATEDHR